MGGWEEEKSTERERRMSIGMLGYIEREHGHFRREAFGLNEAGREREREREREGS